MLTNVVDVTAITGQKVAGPVTSWVVPDGPFLVEHLAGPSPSGDLLVFFWSPRADWQAVNVTQITGQKVAGPVTSWVVPDGPLLVEHLAGRTASGSLVVFWWSPARNWQVVDVSGITGQNIAGPVTSWVTGNVEHLGGQAPDGSLAVFWWTPATNWQVVNVSGLTGRQIRGVPTVYQLPDGQENAEVLGARDADGSLVQFWWKPSLDWQALNVTEATGRTVASDPVSWVVPSGADSIEHFAATTGQDALLVFWGDAEPRRLTDALSRPFQSMKRLRSRREVLVILWDPHRPTDPAPSRAAVESTIFGVVQSVRDYFLQNSGGFFTIDAAAVLGWYPADKSASYYWGPPDTGDTNGDGWVNPHVEKWAEAIRKADVEFDFRPFDRDPFDGNLRPDELGLVIVIPQNSPFGDNRAAVGREFPVPEPLVVDGVAVSTIAETYIGSPPNLGLVAHELSHLLLGTGDMYFNFYQPFAAGDYSLMDRTYKTTHLDPFAKLKFGWLRPKIIFRSGRYSIADIETRHEVLVLLDPRRGPDEYFLVENRWPGGSYDQQMADAGGLGIWHIMERPEVYGALPAPPGVAPANWAQIAPGDWGRRAIQLIRPVFGPPLDDAKALWDGAEPETGYDLLSDDPNPTHARLRWADGTPSGFALRSFSPAGAIMSVTVEVPF
jgi:M6 family metalloprotease-like protein